MLDAAKNAPAAAAAGPAKVEAKEEAAPEDDKKEEAEDVDVGGLFGADDDYY